MFYLKLIKYNKIMKAIICCVIKSCNINCLLFIVKVEELKLEINI